MPSTRYGCTVQRPPQVRRPDPGGDIRVVLLAQLYQLACGAVTMASTSSHNPDQDQHRPGDDHGDVSLHGVWFSRAEIAAASSGNGR